MTDHIAPTGPIENRPTGLRTHLCGVLRPSDQGARVRVCGWVGRRREHGEHLAFIDLRDHTGVVQCVIDTKVDVRSEWVIAIEGTVRHRPEGTVNPGLATGEIELGECTVVVLNEAEPPPFSVDDRDESDEQVRLRYRYIDLRRPRMQANLRLRARVNAAIRAAMDRQGFCEVETPLLWAPTPEGSREFSVPSRLHHGSFYALPQSPQLAKQLLMVGGFDRYYQIARCFRDEDLRADRQFEFSQLDMEVSFATQDDVMAYVSEAVLDAAEAATGERPPPIARMTWADALERYGTDKPDLRFGMELVDLAVEFAHTEVRAFSGSHLKAMCVPDGASFTRSRLDALGEHAKRAGAAGLAWFRVIAADGGGLTFDSPLNRFLSDIERAALLEKTGAKEGDLILAVSDTHRIACTTLGTLRVALGSPPVGQGPHRYVWVVDFPMFDGVDAIGNPQPAHHPFTMPYEEDLALLDTGPLRRALAGLRPRPQRLGIGIGECPYPPPGYPVAHLRHARDQRRGGREPVRLPAQRVPLRRAAACRLRLRHRSPGGGAGRGGEHPRGDRLSEDPVGCRPPHRCPERTARGRSGRAGDPHRGPAPDARHLVDLSLFAEAAHRNLERQAPLAARLRPRTLDEMVGQEHLVAPGAPLRTLAESDRVGSAILWGPAGTGKTTLARLLAATTAKHLVTLSATAAGVKDVREALAEAERRLGEHRQGTMLFVDEVHRFNKSQQDVLLPAVEDGLVVLIGATTENPFFEVNPPLLSRSSLWRLRPLSPENLRTLIWRGLAAEDAAATDDAVDAVVAACEGDARAALTTVEVAVALARAALG